jgi:hypothetical protein
MIFTRRKVKNKVLSNIYKETPPHEEESPQEKRQGSTTDRTKQEGGAKGQLVRTFALTRTKCFGILAINLVQN